MVAAEPLEPTDHIAERDVRRLCFILSFSEKLLIS